MQLRAAPLFPPFPCGAACVPDTRSSRASPDTAPSPRVAGRPVRRTLHSTWRAVAMLGCALLGHAAPLVSRAPARTLLPPPGALSPLRMRPLRQVHPGHVAPRGQQHVLYVRGRFAISCQAHYQVGSQCLSVHLVAPPPNFACPPELPGRVGVRLDRECFHPTRTHTDASAHPVPPFL